MQKLIKQDLQELLVFGYIRCQIEETAFGVVLIPIAIKILCLDFARISIAFGSSILTSKQEMDFILLLRNRIAKYFHPSNVQSKFELIYRGSENDFSAKEFHWKCDDKSPTITIIHSEHDHIFGGFTEMSWKGDDWKRDPNAFLFLIQTSNAQSANNERLPKTIELKNVNDNYAVGFGHSFGPSFGLGNDICIVDRCNEDHDGILSEGTVSYSFIGGPYSSYDYKGNELVGGKLVKGNRYYFKVLEYEVFHLTQSTKCDDKVGNGGRNINFKDLRACQWNNMDIVNQVTYLDDSICNI